MAFEDITLRVEEGIGILSLNRPERGNAVRPQTLAEICEGMDSLDKDVGVKAIIFRGEGKHFCTGADFAFLDSLTTMSPVDVQSQIYHHFQGAARRIYHCRKPTIALIAGAAVTVGCELSLACDFRLVSEGAFFQESWIKLGLLPPLGGLFLLPRMVGLGRAKQMILRAEAITAETAISVGLAMEVLKREDLDARGKQVALELSRLAPLAYASAKQAMHRGMETTMEAEWSSNVLNQAVLLSSNDFREGLSAVKEKRQPSFHGS
ncbi:MAG: enoyl-CoA hydratase/isomerase family protein [Steroidobacteraceae bacterium]